MGLGWLEVGIWKRTGDMMVDHSSRQRQRPVEGCCRWCKMRGEMFKKCIIFDAIVQKPLAPACVA
jgi:hypothetical protein